MKKIRAKFKRGEQVKFISHLDIMKVFERALKRAELPIAHSKGFNPHPQIVFGLPLSVGVVSYSEYVDFEFEKEIEVDDFIEGLNNQLPAGFEILDAKIKNIKPNIMATIDKATYQLIISLDLLDGKNVLTEKIEEILSKDVIMAVRVSKKGDKYINIRPMIDKISVNVVDGIDNQSSSLKQYSFNMQLSAGSRGNLKPELFITEFNNINEFECKIIKTIRTGLYIKKDEKLFEPLDDEILIVT